MGILSLGTHVRAAHVTQSALATQNRDTFINFVYLQCAEALGAIADPQSIPVLEQFSSDPAPEVSETCQLAVERMTWATQQGSADEAKVRQRH